MKFRKFKNIYIDQHGREYTEDEWEKFKKSQKEAPVNEASTSASDWSDSVTTHTTAKKYPTKGSGIPSEGILLKNGYTTLDLVPVSQNDLMAVPGIGKVAANKIISWTGWYNVA